MDGKGAFSDGTLTLNKQTGNINISGFTTGGVQSVDVSLSGSTLTVSVDGVSDSVNLGSIRTPELAFKFTYAQMQRVGVFTAIGLDQITYGCAWTFTYNLASIPFGTNSVYISEIPNDAVIYTSAITRNVSGDIASCKHIQYSSVDHVSISGTGSGTVRIVGTFFSTSSSNIYSTSASEKPHIDYIIEDAEIIDVQHNLCIYPFNGGSTRILLDCIESISLF